MVRQFLITVVLFLGLGLRVFCQGEIRVEPPFWWAGMQNTSLQLMLHGTDIGEMEFSIKNDRLNVVKVHKADSPNFLFVDISIKSADPGSYELILKDKKSETIHEVKYELKARKSDSAQRKGIDPSDVVYLITPDRFSNGDPTNDEVEGLKEGLLRNADYGRHGGDIKGIEDHLDYIKDMGFTAIWLNPVLMNDQPEWSYHGYATTDYYSVDPRFGSNESYEKLSRKAADQGVGMIMDIIVNHCGSHHWWMSDPPFENWINGPREGYMQTNHRKETLLDPYASRLDRETMVNGWFVPAMPDLNQRNAFMSTYLIQNSIWWIEYAHLAAIRQDTYSYPFREFMADWTCAIMNEYPNFYIVGEEWVDDAAMISYWQEGKLNAENEYSCLPGLMDFPLCFSINKALTNDETWDTGLIEIYQSLSSDHHYPDPSQLVIFTDNHDMKRTYVELGEDLDRFKMAMALLMTTRGIPQLYYGTEILMNTGKDGSHGLIRSDFPGGWVGDSISAKENRGLTLEQKEGQNFCRQLLQWRKNKSIIHTGKLMHFVPKDGVYVYFRYDDSKAVMVVLNKNEEETNLELVRFQERLSGYALAKDVLSGNEQKLEGSLTLSPMQAYIFELH